MNKRLIVLSLVALFAVALPPVASADDASVYAAWSSRDAEQKKVDSRFQRAFKRYKRSDARVWKPLYRASKAYAKVAGQVEAAVKGQTASTPEGEKVRTLAIQGVRHHRLAFTATARGIRLSARRRFNAADKALTRAIRLEKRAARYIRRANSGFKALGFS